MKITKPPLAVGLSGLLANLENPSWDKEDWLENTGNEESEEDEPCRRTLPLDVWAGEVGSDWKKINSDQLHSIQFNVVQFNSILFISIQFSLV